MNQHPYLRAYMAGITVPTALFLVGLTVFSLARLVFNMPVAVERVIIFPMTIIPNAFGLWNMLYVKLPRNWQTPIGLHGALLWFFLGPTGLVIGAALGFIRSTEHGLLAFDIVHIPYWWLAVGPFCALAFYYLVWKYAVGFLNRLLGIAG